MHAPVCTENTYSNVVSHTTICECDCECECVCVYSNTLQFLIGSSEFRQPYRALKMSRIQCVWWVWVRVLLYSFVFYASLGVDFFFGRGSDEIRDKIYFIQDAEFVYLPQKKLFSDCKDEFVDDDDNDAGDDAWHQCLNRHFYSPRCMWARKSACACVCESECASKHQQIFQS